MHLLYSKDYGSGQFINLTFEMCYNVINGDILSELRQMAEVFTKG